MTTRPSSSLLPLSFFLPSDVVNASYASPKVPLPSVLPTLGLMSSGPQLSSLLASMALRKSRSSRPFMTLGGDNRYRKPRMLPPSLRPRSTLLASLSGGSMAALKVERKSLAAGAKAERLIASSSMEHRTPEARGLRESDLSDLPCSPHQPRVWVGRELVEMKLVETVHECVDMKHEARRTEQRSISFTDLFGSFSFIKSKHDGIMP
mmetsp:Transcript_48128/g.151015  ORF Transcript_48128/g.151015 Transcript_48128/m.151015 type:complete len:207 (-) Transcript_48128:12-632(-)